MKTLLSCLVVVGIVVSVMSTSGCGEAEPTPPPGLNEAQLAGWQVYVDLNCASCHGALREGKRSGPTLADLDTHWEKAQLVEYLRNPQAMIKRIPRLAYRAEQYPIDMPAYGDKADDTKLAALADYLLVDVE